MLGGKHGARCLYNRRQRRPGLTTRYGVVSEQEILELYLEHRAHAVQLARRIVGADAEDVVHDVMLYLLEKRDYLRDAPGAAYFLTAVKNTALRRLLYAWARYVVTVPDEQAGLVLAKMKGAGVPCARIGTTGGDAMAITGEAAVPVASLKTDFENWFPAYMNAKAS